jgi:sporulation protein YlmC with PRC-barrel domain
MSNGVKQCSCGSVIQSVAARWIDAGHLQNRGDDERESIMNKIRTMKSSDLAFINYLEDVRGQEVIDSKGEVIGEVDALLVDEDQKKVRFLYVATSASDGRDRFVIPVDALSGVRRGGVRVDRPREELALAPGDAAVLRKRENVEELYRYYGFKPFWARGYKYPPYPFYA